MPSCFDYRDILAQEFNRRCRGNPRYSLRSFARDLRLPVSQVSVVLKKRGAFSPARALQVGVALGLDVEVCRALSFSAEALHGRTELARTRAQSDLSLILPNLGRTKDQVRPFSGADFQRIEGWYPLAVLELAKIEGFDLNARSIARRLGVTVPEAASALKRLRDVGMLKKRGQHWVATGGVHANPTGETSESARNFHLQYLQLASRALVTQPAAERWFETGIYAFDPADMKSVVALIDRFMKKLEQKMARGKSRTSVFSMGVQWFRVDDQESGKGKSV